MVRTAAAIAKQKGYDGPGYRTVFNCNAQAGQTVFHIHLHVLGGRCAGVAPGLAFRLQIADFRLQISPSR